MADDDKVKANPPQKPEAPAGKKGSANVDSSNTEGSEKTAPGASYSRGEGQKPVSKAYKENWNAIFAKKKKR
jgi:hypothetical protein